MVTDDGNQRPTTWVLILAFPFVNYVTLGKLLTISAPIKWILANAPKALRKMEPGML